MRYDQLIPILRDLQPLTVLEVGTWNGSRALEMMAACPKGAMYYGFDLFEDATDETDNEEFNVKAHHNQIEVGRKLARAHLPFSLIKGNTRETLPKFASDMGDNWLDFAFIDGGHSVDTIASDWRTLLPCVKRGGIVVFDDFYSGMPAEKLEKIGCNKLIGSFDEYTILHGMDGVAGGGAVQMVSVQI